MSGDLDIQVVAKNKLINLLFEKIAILTSSAHPSIEKLEKVDKKIEDNIECQLFEVSTENCPHCGTTEMLCGHNGVGCSHVKEEI